jgi:phospholipid N-methyltransferase
MSEKPSSLRSGDSGAAGLPRPPVWIFLSRFFRSPRAVGSIAPSSRFLARKMVSRLPLTEAVKVVELGPGTGPFTAEILRRLPPGGRYAGIERDPVFVDVLRRLFPDVEIVHGSAGDLIEIAGARGLLPVDHIISGLPFASLPAALIHRILDAVEAALRAGGTFTTFQYLHAYGLPSARLFRREMGRRFGPMVSRRVELLNLPPAFVLEWVKPARGGEPAPAASAGGGP